MLVSLIVPQRRSLLLLLYRATSPDHKPPIPAEEAPWEMTTTILAETQFLAIGIEKLQHTPPISATAMTKRSAHEQPSRVLETELNAIKSSCGRREPTSRSSPSSLLLRYDDRATVNDETTSAPIPSARQEIIHHFSRRFHLYSGQRLPFRGCNRRRKRKFKFLNQR